MRKTISILGCGWLGSALGKSLLSKKYIVKGSTTSNEKYNELEMSGIQPYYLKIEANSLEIDYSNFFNTDVLIIALPPGRIENIEAIFPKQIAQIIRFIKEIKIKKVLFISSTSVYESTNKTVKEGDEGIPEKPNGRALLEAEKMLLGIEGTKTTVLRFSGLIGYNRNPARFLIGKNNVPDVPVNLIHRDDCVRIINEIIENNVWGEIYNASSPEHPSKKVFYTRAAKIGDLPVPGFIENQGKYKIVNSDKLINNLNYNFLYPNPLKYLKELEEWAYRI